MHSGGDKPKNVGVPVYLEAKVQFSTNSLNNNGSPAPRNQETELDIELPQMSSEAPLNWNSQTTEESDTYLQRTL